MFFPTALVDMVYTMFTANNCVIMALTCLVAVLLPANLPKKDENATIRLQNSQKQASNRQAVSRHPPPYRGSAASSLASMSRAVVQGPLFRVLSVSQGYRPPIP